MLLIVEKSIRVGTCHTIYRYAKANNIYMKYYDKNKETSHLKYWDIKNLCEDFRRTYNDECDEGYFLEIDGHYLKILYNLHNDLPQRMKN